MTFTFTLAFFLSPSIYIHINIHTCREYEKGTHEHLYTIFFKDIVEELKYYFLVFFSFKTILLCKSCQTYISIIEGMGMQKDMKKKGIKTKYKKDDFEEVDSNEDCPTKVVDKKLQDYVVKKIIKKSLKKTSSLKLMNVVGYSNDDNPFGDCNLSQPFV